MYHFAFLLAMNGEILLLNIHISIWCCRWIKFFVKAHGIPFFHLLLLIFTCLYISKVGFYRQHIDNLYVNSPWQSLSFNWYIWNIDVLKIIDIVWWTSTIFTYCFSFVSLFFFSFFPCPAAGSFVCHSFSILFQISLYVIFIFTYLLFVTSL